MNRALEAQRRLADADERHNALVERLQMLQDASGTHGSQILRLFDLGVEKWPEIKNDMGKVKADSINVVRDVSTLKKEVADLRETSTRTWREIAGLHQDNAQLSSLQRHGLRTGGPPSVGKTTPDVGALAQQWRRNSAKQEMPPISPSKKKSIIDGMYGHCPECEDYMG